MNIPKQMFDVTSDLHLELAEEILMCIHMKSKWAMGVWTWVSLSNLKIQYDSDVVRNYNGFSFQSISLEAFLLHLVQIGLVERNTELFLKDQFFRLTPHGRELVTSDGNAIYTFLTNLPTIPTL